MNWISVLIQKNILQNFLTFLPCEDAERRAIYGILLQQPEWTETQEFHLSENAGKVQQIDIKYYASVY